MHGPKCTSRIWNRHSLGRKDCVTGQENVCVGGYFNKKCSYVLGVAAWHYLNFKRLSQTNMSKDGFQTVSGSVKILPVIPFVYYVYYSHLFNLTTHAYSYSCSTIITWTYSKIKEQLPKKSVGRLPTNSQFTVGQQSLKSQLSANSSPNLKGKALADCQLTVCHLLVNCWSLASEPANKLNTNLWDSWHSLHSLLAQFHNTSLLLPQNFA